VSSIIVVTSEICEFDLHRHLTFCLAETRDELEPLMAHLLEGNDLESWFSAMHEPAKLGKGCREPAKKVLSSESEPDKVVCMTMMLLYCPCICFRCLNAIWSISIASEYVL